MAKEKIGVFSESDARKIARAIKQFIREPTGNRSRHRKRVVSGGGAGSSCPSEIPDIIDAADADYVSVVRIVDGVPTCVVCELQPVICSSVSPPSSPSSPSSPGSVSPDPSFSVPSGGFSDCPSEWGSDCLPPSVSIEPEPI